MSYDLSRAHPNNPYRQPTFHPRTEWVEPLYPITGQKWLGFGAGSHKVNTQVVHYPGGKYSVALLSTDPDLVRARLRAANRSSWINRNYSLYYNFDLPTDGSLWEIRGFTVRNAANADDNPADGNENEWSYAVHSIFDKVTYDIRSNVTVEPTWDQWETLRWLRWEAREYAIEETGDPTFQIDCVPHCDIKPTGCCGDKGIAGIRLGVVDIPARNVPPVVLPPIDEPAPIPQPDPAITPLEDDTMITLDLGKPGVDSWWTRMTWTGAELSWVQGEADHVLRRVGVKVAEVSEPEVLDIIKSSKTVTPSPFVPGGQAPNEALHAAWVASAA